MLKKIIKITYIFALSFFISSCATKKNTIYFQSNTNTVQALSDFSNEYIVPNDILNIAVSALDMTSIAPFLKAQIMSNNMDQSLIEGYKVAKNGEIQLPLVGSVNVNNLNIKQAAHKIQKLLSKSIIDPIVNIRLLNYKITILGEVKNPGTFTIYDPKINIIQALGLAGDITIHGKKKNIKIIREINGNSVSTQIDLTNTNFISSDFYYLRKNDVVYVEPTFAKIKNSGYIGQISNVATVFSLIMSIIILSNNN
jgi:polysaccharide export outer membrane protein